jgi:hypothetical protein
MGDLTYMVLSYAPLETSARHAEQRTKKDLESPFEIRHLYTTKNPDVFEQLRKNPSVYWMKTVESSGISVAIQDAIENFYEQAEHILTCGVCWNDYDGAQWRIGDHFGKDSEYSEVKKAPPVYAHSEKPKLRIKAAKRTRKSALRVDVLNIR